MKLRDLAYYKTGGDCQNLYEPQSTEELARIVARLHRDEQKFFVLGAGTNSLVLDEEWPGGVIIFSKMKSIRQSDQQLICEAGADNTTIAQFALKAGLSGISWMNRLPGQIGATVRMNARCYGGEISEVATEVTAVLPDGTIRHYKPEDKVFKGYKDTLFMDNGAIVTEVKLQLKTGDREKIEAHMSFCEDDRVGKGQFLHPTCGCVFKNNYSVGVPSGMLLDRAGAHQLNTPDVALNPKHANFVYNKGAGSREILEITLRMRELVYQVYGVWMEYEMEILGEMPPDLLRKIQVKREPKLNEEKIAPLRAIFQGNANRMVPET